MHEPSEVETLPESARRRSGARRVTPFLVVSLGDTRQLVPLKPDVAVTIGRGAEATVRLDDQTLSRRHAEFRLDADGVTVRDLGSRNGTRINDVRLESLVLHDGDGVDLGRAHVTLHLTGVERAALLAHGRVRAVLSLELGRASLLRETLSLAVSSNPTDGVGLRANLRSFDRMAVLEDGRLVVMLPQMTPSRAQSLLHVYGVGATWQIVAFPAQGSKADELLEAALAPAPRAVEGAQAHVGVPGVVQQVRKLGPSDVSVLIRGETGTGKEVVARLVHSESRRRRGPFVAMNCGAIPATLLESVLFGHERGAFTGAVTSAVGVFEQAEGGTLLLDEVGELAPAAQAALLRVLETRKLRRVGGAREVAVDVRVLAATHRDLEAMTQTGAFRVDLWFRLNAFQIELPALRERPRVELEALVKHFIALCTRLHGVPIQGVTPEALEVLHRYAWPGNVRELKNAIEHAVVIGAGPMIDVDHLPARVSGRAIPRRAEVASSEPAVDGLRDRLDEYESRRLLDALRAAAGNRSKAAEALGIPLRTLYYRLKRLGISRSAEKPGSP